MERTSFIFSIPTQGYRRASQQNAFNINRTKTPNREHMKPPAPSDSYESIASIYARVVEQELNALSQKTEETRRWVLEQQIQFGLHRDRKKTQTRDTHSRRERRSNARTRLLDGMIYGFGQDAETARQAAAAEEMRQARRHEELNRMLKDEFGRMEARWQERTERAQRRILETRKRAEEAKEKQEMREKVEKQRMAEGWSAYEKRWATIRGSTEKLTFKEIPWPIARTVRNAADITSEAVIAFILSPAHSEGVSRRDRIRDALRRWHPDRFGRLTSRVIEKDKDGVVNAVNVVARCLTDLMEKENGSMRAVSSTGILSGSY